MPIMTLSPACSLYAASTFLTLSLPLLASAQSGSTRGHIVNSENATQVVETSILPESGHTPITETVTFNATTYSQYRHLNATIHTDTVIPVTSGTHVASSTYGLEIGPGGLGWSIPKPSSGVPLLSQPPFLPANGSTTGKLRSDTGTGSGTTIGISLSTNLPSHTQSRTTSLRSPVSNSTRTATSSHTTPTSHTVSMTTTMSSSHTSMVTTPRSSPTPTSTSASSTSAPRTISTGSNSPVTGANPSHTTSAGSSPGTSNANSPSNSHAITGTITSVPSGFSQITASGTTFTANDWVTTTDSSHHTTLVPFILVDGGRGISLPGLPPIPNVEFDFPDIPKFHLPCIKVFGVQVAGDCSSPPVEDSPPSESGSPSNQPSDSASPSKTGPSSTSSRSSTSSPSSCSATQTASDCAVTCVSSVSTSSSISCASYSTTCSKTLTACSATGTTSTITGSSNCLESPPSSFLAATSASCGVKCSPGTAAKSGLISVTTSPPNPSPDYRRRAIAGRVTIDPLEKRQAPSTIAKLGTCALQTPAALPLTLPGWPSIFNDIYSPDQAGNMQQKFSTISRYDRATQSGCVFTTTRLSANDFKNAPTWSDYFRNNFDDGNNRPTLDHAYEKAWLKEFFTSIVGNSNGAGALDCNQVNQYFFPGSGNCQRNVMQAVWDQLASDDNLYFIVMSQYLNGNAKGQFFPSYPNNFQQAYVNDPSFDINANPNDWVWQSNPPNGKWSARDELMQMISYFEVVLYGVLEMKSSNMLELIDRTNNGIYTQLLILDNTIKANPGNIFGNLQAWNTAFPNGIAGAYRNYMTSRIEPQIQTPPKYLRNLYENRIGLIAQQAYHLNGVSVNPNQQYVNEWNSIWTQLTAHTQHYYTGGGAPTWDYDFSFSWEAGRSNTKRDAKEHLNELLFGRAGSCSFAIDSSVPASVTVNSTVVAVSTGDFTVSDPSAQPTSVSATTTSQASSTSVTSTSSTSTQPASTSSSSTSSSSSSLPPPSTSTEAPSTTEAPPAPSPSCTLFLAYGGGRDPIILEKSCKCNDGSSPPVTISNDEYHCPNQVTMIA